MEEEAEVEAEEEAEAEMRGRAQENYPFSCLSSVPYDSECGKSFISNGIMGNWN